jgi:hypothetical protein
MPEEHRTEQKQMGAYRVERWHQREDENIEEMGWYRRGKEFDEQSMDEKGTHEELPATGAGGSSNPQALALAACDFVSSGMEQKSYEAMKISLK